MDKGMLVMAAVALCATGCAGHETAAPKAPPAAPAPTGLTGPIAPPLSAAAGIDASALTLPPMTLEPVACPIYAGDDRPDFDADGLKCIVQWMRETQDYLAKGGKPTKYTNAEAFEQYRGYAREMQTRLGKFVAQAPYDAGDAAPTKATGALPIVPPGGAAAALTPELQRAANSLEALSCMLYGPEGRPDEDAKGLKCLVFTLRQAQYYAAQGGKPTQYINPTTFETDRVHALERLARLERFFASARYEAVAAPAAPAPASAGSAPDGHAASAQAYLEGVIEFQKGDYAAARKAWGRALKLDPASDDAKAGLSRLDQLEK